ncbi:MAG: hypothetical protein EOQ90_06325 [Mesorhizobium sp.]|nr:MAG: hypothetical protein EOQ90_06325 [Mesorhizobium sp.]RWM85124.1 MAG: hypothetical protein EOR83_12490 [Mesorhizobium sp.]
MISPLEGEMSPKATEGVASRRAPTFSFVLRGVAPAEPTPSGLPAISPSRGEIIPLHRPAMASGLFSSAARSGVSIDGRLVKAANSRRT